MNRADLLQLYQRLGLTPIPLKTRSKEPIVKWGNGWNPTFEELEACASQRDLNWGIRCGQELAVLDFDNPDSLHRFTATHPLPPRCPVVKTGRGFHIWLKPKKAVPSQKVSHLDCELLCLGKQAVVPPSVHPNGRLYTFEAAPNGALEVDLAQLLGLSEKRYSQRTLPRGEPSDNSRWWLDELQRVLPQPLDKVGSNGEYRTRCVFHHPDNNPSLHINPSKGVFNCFGCGARGSLPRLPEALGGKSSANNFPAWVEELRVKVTAALRGLGDRRSESTLALQVDHQGKRHRLRASAAPDERGVIRCLTEY